MDVLTVSERILSCSGVRLVQLPYLKEELGSLKVLIFLMAMLQENKQKVRLVLDYQNLSQYVDAHTANADICAQKLREWQ